MAAYDLSIIVVAWNVKELLVECFDAIRSSDDEWNKQILLVDNGSVDGSADFVEEQYPEVTVIRSPTNLGFIRANNLAYEQAEGEYILMLNSDAFVSSSAIRSVVDFMREHPEAGVVGARLIGRDGVLQPSARYFPTPFKLFLQKLGWDGKVPFVKALDDLSWDHQSIRECDWVVGCYLLTRKELIDKSGFFLRQDYFLYNDDNDLCFRIKKMGYKTFFYPVDVVHIGGANVKKMHKKAIVDDQMIEYQIESQMIYFRKNYGIGKVLANWFWFQVYNALVLVKYLLLFRFRRLGKEIIPSIIMVNSIALGSRLGLKSIH